MSNEYEFTADQNTILEGLAQKMKIVAYFEIGIGALFLLSVLLGNFAEVGQGIFQMVIGVLTFKASRFFQAIVDSEGNDISHLMKAILELRNVYSIQFWMMIILAIVVGVALVAGVALGVSAINQ